MRVIVMRRRMAVAMTVLGTVACGGGGIGAPADSSNAAPTASTRAADRRYLLERVDDAAVVQVYADGFDQLSLKEKTLVWHLYQAALAGRDIYYDQRYEHNLEMRDLLEAVITHSRSVDPKTL